MLDLRIREGYFDLTRSLRNILERRFKMDEVVFFCHCLSSDEYSFELKTERRISELRLKNLLTKEVALCETECVYFVQYLLNFLDQFKTLDLGLRCLFSRRELLLLTI